MDSWMLLPGSESSRSVSSARWWTWRLWTSTGSCERTSGTDADWTRPSRGISTHSTHLPVAMTIQYRGRCLRSVFRAQTSYFHITIFHTHCNILTPVYMQVGRRQPLPWHLCSSLGCKESCKNTPVDWECFKPRSHLFCSYDYACTNCAKIFKRKTCLLFPLRPAVAVNTYTTFWDWSYDSLHDWWCDHIRLIYDSVRSIVRTVMTGHYWSHDWGTTSRSRSCGRQYLSGRLKWETNEDQMDHQRPADTTGKEGSNFQGRKMQDRKTRDRKMQDWKRMIARLKNAGPKMQGWKMQNRKMRDRFHFVNWIEKTRKNAQYTVAAPVVISHNRSCYLVMKPHEIARLHRTPSRTTGECHDHPRSCKTARDWSRNGRTTICKTCVRPPTIGDRCNRFCLQLTLIVWLSTTTTTSCTIYLRCSAIWLLDWSYKACVTGDLNDPLDAS